ncbi:Uncharacterised protein [Mycobacteroides abscessus subsp. abscessus]|uniref:hypothetical protein n=1 Tax=Mycobacteroides abscessus TaxID=36809 RepID=UPI00092945BD|nr:hypothetical protein [Mycobacteroides abscessus]SHU29124.1 Uncharacterised protein [Mycobacteroides abscessus subsp. abscessus]
MTTATLTASTAPELAIENAQPCALCERPATDPLPFHGEQACASCLTSCQVCGDHTTIGALLCALCELNHPGTEIQGRAQ